MKTKQGTRLRWAGLAGLAIYGAQAAPALAGYPMYPPTLQDSYTFFEDSENARGALRCSGDAPSCVNAYFIPRGIKVARTDRDQPMIAQGLFFARNSMRDSTVVYNITLEPDYKDLDAAVTKIKANLARKYGLKPENVSVAPIGISNVQFVLRNTFGASPSAPAPGAAPPTPDELGKKIANATTYTNTVVPEWQGDWHQLGSRFSVTVKGPIWDLEPGLTKMVLSPAGNAFVGSVAFGFRVKAQIVKMTIDCDVQKFQQVVKSTVKSWHITRVRNGNSTYEYFNNDERNAIRRALTIEDYCTIKEFADNTVPAAMAFSSRAQQMFDKMFESAFRQVDGSTIDQPMEGRDARYTYLESIAGADARGHVVLNLESEQVFQLHSDLDFYAGDVPEANLDPAHIYLCEPFEKFDRVTRKCELACERDMEVYMPRHPRADRRTGCVDITNQPLFEPAERI